MRLASFGFFLFLFYFLVGFEAKACQFSFDNQSQVLKVEIQSQDQIRSGGPNENHDWFPSVYGLPAQAVQFISCSNEITYTLSLPILLKVRFYCIKTGLSPPFISFHA